MNNNMHFDTYLLSGQRFKTFLLQVFSGNPADMVIQAMVGITGGLMSVIAEVNPFIGAYIAIVAVDTFLGVRLSKKEGKAFSWSHLLWGPGQKIVFTAVILVAAQFMEVFMPGEFLTQGIGAYMSAVLFLEAVGKYDKLTGNSILDAVRGKLAAFGVKKDKPE